MAQKFKLRAVQYDRDKEEFVDTTTKTGLGNFVIDLDDMSSLRAAAVPVLQAILRGHKVNSYVYVDRDAIVIDEESLFGSPE